MISSCTAAPGGRRAAGRRSTPSSANSAELADDETLLVQSGKPVGVFRTHEWAPRVLIANSNLVPDWADWDEFRRLEDLGLTMYGQMTAGSWIYIGTQGILQGTYECFSAIAAKRFGGSLSGTLTLTAGLGGMGGAQPLAVTMNGGVVLCVEVDPRRIERRLHDRYLDEATDSLADALERVAGAVADRRPLSVGLLANAADVVPRLAASDVSVDIVTDQTSAHDPLSYVPTGLSITEAEDLRGRDPETYVKRSRESMAGHCAGMVAFLDKGAEVFDYGNSLRAEARDAGFDRAFDYPGFIPAYIRPLFCEGEGPVPLGGAVGRPGRHRGHRRGRARRVPRQRAVGAVDPPGGGEGAVPGAARPHLLARLRRARPDGDRGSTTWWRPAVCPRPS